MHTTLQRTSSDASPMTSALVEMLSDDYENSSNSIAPRAILDCIRPDFVAPPTGEEADGIAYLVTMVPTDGSSAREQLRAEIEQDPTLRRYVTAFAAARAASKAKSTRTKYASQFAQYTAWCASHGLPAISPLSPFVVAVYVGFLLAEPRPTTGRLLSADSIAYHLAAIDYAHEYAGYARPSTGNELIRQAISGARRRQVNQGWTKRQRTPLRPADLRAIVDCTRTVDEEHRLFCYRDRALVSVYAALRRAGHTRIVKPLVSLDWSDVALSSDALTVRLASGSRSPEDRVITLPATGTASCPVACLADWREVEGPFASGPVFPTLDVSNRLGRWHHVGVLDALQRLCGDRGASASRREPGALSQGDVDRFCASALPAAGPHAVRDIALILFGWKMAARASNITLLRHQDLTVVDGAALKVLLYKSKTDQEGRGHTIVVPREADEQYCAVAALEAWVSLKSRLLGRDPHPWEPVFCSLGPRGMPTEVADDPAGPSFGPEGQRFINRPLTTDDVNAVVGKRARAAALNGDFGSHSLRRGWLTTAAESGQSIIKIALHSGHAKLETVMQYINEADLTRDRANAAFAVRVSPG